MKAMAMSSKRLFVVLSLCLLLQQFSPAYAANLSHTKDKHSKKSHKVQHNEDDGYQEEHQNAEKRGAGKIFGTILRKGWDLLGDANVIKKINFATEVTSSIIAAVSIGLTVTTAIAGCTAIAPDLTENWNKYTKLDEEFRELSNDIDKIHLQAESRQIYVNSTFYEYRRTRDKLQEIADEKERIFKSFGPETTIATLNATHEIEQLVKDKNATGELIEDVKVSQGFTEGYELALELIFPSITLTYSGFRLLWNFYLKDTVVGKAISSLPDTVKNKIKSSPTTESKKVSSGRVMNTKFGKGLQAIGDTVKPKLNSAFNFVKNVYKRFEPLLVIGAAAFDIWSIFANVKKCTDMGEKSAESIKKMTEFVESTREILEEVKKANNEIQAGYDEVHKYIFDEIILDAITQLKAMMSNTKVAQATEDSAAILLSLENFLNAKDMDINDDNSKLTVDTLQRELNDALHRIPFTLECYTIKGSVYSNVKKDCAEGRDSLSEIYVDVQGKLGIHESNKCAERTGSLFASSEDMKAAWEKWATDNGTQFETICLMNNDFIVDNMIKLLQQGKTDPQEIADALGKSKATDEVTAMIEKLKDDPRVKVLPIEAQRLICLYKDMLKKTADQAFPDICSLTTTKITRENYENQVCPLSDSDGDEDDNSDA